MRKQCNFCGRSERDVKLLISGVSGFICEDCARQAYQIVQESGLSSVKESDTVKFKLKDVPKPREIKDYLDQYIIGLTRPSAICR